MTTTSQDQALNVRDVAAETAGITHLTAGYGQDPAVAFAAALAATAISDWLTTTR